LAPNSGPIAFDDDEPPHTQNTPAEAASIKMERQIVKDQLLPQG
jgi:hypothetical protein